MKKYTGRDSLMVKLLTGSTKAGINTDRKKQANKQECRMAKQEKYTTEEETEIESLCEWALGVFPEGHILAIVGDKHYSNVTCRDFQMLKVAYDAWNFGFETGLENST